MLPARTDIAGNLVYLFLRQGDSVRAQRMVDDALVHGGDPAALAAARAAIATFKENKAARQSLRNVAPSPQELAGGEAFRTREARRLREEIEATQDPEARGKLEAALKAIEHPSIADYNDAVKVFNEAVDRANTRDYPGAIALLEALLPKVEDPEFRTRIETLLERLRKDSARLQPVQ